MRKNFYSAYGDFYEQFTTLVIPVSQEALAFIISHRNYTYQTPIFQAAKFPQKL